MVARGLIIAVLLALTTGCSRTELAYRNADWVLEYYAKQAVAASSGQRRHWQPVLQTVLQRHRDEVLPLLIAYLDLVDDAFMTTGDSVGAECLVNGAVLLYERHAQLAADLAAPLLAELDPAQVRHLAGYAKQRQINARKRYLRPDPESQQQARLKRFTGRIERWTGTLDDAQRQQVQEATGLIPDITEPWLAYREQQTGALLQLLEMQADEPALHAYLSGWWVHWEGRPAAYTRDWHIARREFIQLLEKLGASLTDKQRDTLTATIAALRKDFSSILEPSQQPVDMPGGLACPLSPDHSRVSFNDGPVKSVRAP